MKLKLFFFTSFLLFIYTFNANAQSKITKDNSNLIKNILEQHKDLFGDIINHQDKYKVQILYTQINRDSVNFPHFKTYSYHLNPDEYFYPASTVKLPAAILSLEKLNNLKIKGLNKFTNLKTDSAYTGQFSVVYDSSSPNNLPSIAQYVRKIFLVSDNYSFNRLFEFLGQKYLNQQLWKKRYCDTKILRRLSFAFNKETNRHTNPFTFFKGNKVIYKQPAQFNHYKYRIYAESLKQGKGFIRGDSLINKPMDFTYSNYFALNNQQQLLKAILFPEAVPAEQRFNLTKDDYRFVYKYMSMFPRESNIKEYKDYNTYYDSYAKFFIFGTTKDTIPSNIRIFSKSGEAYGYLIDNAYIVDFNNKIEFMLSAMIYVNNNQIFNDDKYQYDKIGYPFLANLGKVIYNYELKRYRKYKPNLNKFKIDYKSPDIY